MLNDGLPPLPRPYLTVLVSLAEAGGSGKLDTHVSVYSFEKIQAAVKAGTAVGLKAKAVMEAGQLVSDDLVLGMLEDRLAEDDAKPGFILDGYPRNVAQAGALDRRDVDEGVAAAVLLVGGHRHSVELQACCSECLDDRSSGGLDNNASQYLDHR